MHFDRNQELALSAVNKWRDSGTEQVFHLFGFAGSGKTTLAKYFAEGISGEVIFAAFTGKAAHVLRTKGCSNAMTIHSLIYHSRDKGKARLRELEEQKELLIKELIKEFSMSMQEALTHKNVRSLTTEIKKETDSTEQPFFTLNHESIIREADLVIIDECSMVDNKMGSDLLSFGVKVLVLGDPAQLPPIMGAGFFTENVNPNIMLSDIHRQAAESPIIRMATQVRNQTPLSLGDYGNNCRYIDSRMDPEEALQFDQILVGRNKTRFSTNRRIRGLKGIEDVYPIIGDRLVCLRNNSDLGLLNGAIFNVSGIEGVLDNKVFMSVQQEDEMESIDVSAHEHYFLGKSDELKWFEKKEAQEFDFGYALTVHKSQGSQWDKVCLFDESWCFRKDKWRWLYTGITRAAEELTVVKM